MVVTVIKTAFSANVNKTSGGGVFTDPMDGLAQLVRSQPFQELNDFMNHLGLGDFQHLINNFSLDTFNALAVKLYALKTHTHPLYVRLLNYMNYCLTTLLIVEVNVGKELVVLKHEIAKLKADNEVLYNVELLKKYLQTLTKKTFTIFPEQNVTTSKIKLRPEYDIYIERYGFPKNGAFNAEHLAQIITELELNGTTE